MLDGEVGIVKVKSDSKKYHLTLLAIISLSMIPIVPREDQYVCGDDVEDRGQRLCKVARLAAQSRPRESSRATPKSHFLSIKRCDWDPL